jgi:hypothetical protein
MDAAIGRLHLTITVARPAPPETPAPPPDDEHLERAFRRQHAEHAAETDRTSWNADFHARGRLY